MKKSNNIPMQLKYELYESSVQNHEVDIEFVQREYKKIFKKNALIFREDFGGTAAMACDWTKLSDKHEAYAIDLDPEPIAYGKETHYARLNDDQKSRMHYVEGNVLDPVDFKADITVAFNFSYFIFKERNTLLNYFKQVREGLSDQGAFFIDLFGGTEAYDVSIEETEHDDHTYYWDCDKFNPITNECLYYIHFKDHNTNTKYEKAFTYDWRMWAMPELIDILKDAGFTQVTPFWEGVDDDGSGDGNFYPADDEENCESWVTYICATK